LEGAGETPYAGPFLYASDLTIGFTLPNALGGVEISIGCATASVAAREMYPARQVQT
jgi:hypothetical protein